MTRDEFKRKHGERSIDYEEDIDDLIAAAREEQHAQDAARWFGLTNVETTPLTATPLADRIRELEAALAAAREEQREVDKRALEPSYNEAMTRECSEHWSAQHEAEFLAREKAAYVVGSAPLTATPLANRIAELEGLRRLDQACIDKCQAALVASYDRIKELEAESATRLEAFQAEAALRAQAVRDRQAAGLRHLERIEELEARLAELTNPR